MAQYPPPPQPDQQHYNALYPSPGGAQQLMDAVHQDHLQFSNLSQPMFSKVEPGAPDRAPSNHSIHQLAQELQQQAELEEQQRQQLQHAAQQMHQSSQNSQPGNSLSSQQNPQMETADQKEKNNRLRKACDSCSIRKVKCDESGPPCRACAALDIPCTFQRPSRRRGPPNKHAEAFKRRRLDEPQMIAEGMSPSSPTHAAQALAALSSHAANQGLSAESICPLETLNLLIDAFFTYIHPLSPFPHEPSFREAWKRREDLNNRQFLALLASMIGALVASFPRKPRLQIKSQKRNVLFPNHVGLVTRCRKICSVARGPGYLESENLNVYDAATSYFLGVAGVHTFEWRLGRLYLGESLNILRTLGLHHKSSQHSHSDLVLLANALGAGAGDSDPQNLPYDNITLEMGRRIFWTLFVTIRTFQQLGTEFTELIIPPPTSVNPYPSFPAEVDDFCIYPDHNEPQPPGLLPMAVGFNANVQVYGSYNNLVTLDLAWGTSALVDIDRQKQVLLQCLRLCKESTNELPPELSIVDFVASYGTTTGRDTDESLSTIFRDPAASLQIPPQTSEVERTPEQRRQMQHDVQKANTFASLLATRMFLVERYFGLCDAHNQEKPADGSTVAKVSAVAVDVPAESDAMIDKEMRQERESVIRDLLNILSKLDRINIEANADSFTMKIRTAANTLLANASVESQNSPLEAEATANLTTFLRTLEQLERAESATDVDQTENDSSDLPEWSILHAAQARMAEDALTIGQ